MYFYHYEYTPQKHTCCTCQEAFSKANISSNPSCFCCCVSLPKCIYWTSRTDRVNIFPSLRIDSPSIGICCLYHSPSTFCWKFGVQEWTYDGLHDDAGSCHELCPSAFVARPTWMLEWNGWLFWLVAVNRRDTSKLQTQKRNDFLFIVGKTNTAFLGFLRTSFCSTLYSFAILGSNRAVAVWTRNPRKAKWYFRTVGVIHEFNLVLHIQDCQCISIDKITVQYMDIPWYTYMGTCLFLCSIDTYAAILGMFVKMQSVLLGDLAQNVLYFMMFIQYMYTWAVTKTLVICCI